MRVPCLSHNCPTDGHVKVIDKDPNPVVPNQGANEVDGDVDDEEEVLENEENNSFFEAGEPTDSDGDDDESSALVAFQRTLNEAGLDLDGETIVADDDSDDGDDEDF